MVAVSTYKPEMGRRICDLIGEGISLNRICKMDDMPDYTTVRRWLRTFPEFKRDYDIAREEMADRYMDEIIDIADGRDIEDRDEDKKIPEIRDGSFVDFGDRRGISRERDASLERDRLRIDTRMRAAGKLRPKAYGATQQVEITETRNITETKISRIELVAPQLEAKPALPVIENEPVHVNSED